MFASAITTRTTSRILLAAAGLPPIWQVGRLMPGFFNIDPTMPLSNHAPNVWTIVQALPVIGALPLTGLAMAAAIGMAFTLGARWITRPPCPSQTIAATLLITLALPGLLPGMGWTDFLPAALCGIALAVHRREKAYAWIAVLTSSGTLLATTGNDLLAMLGAVAMIAVTWFVARQFLVSPANDNGPPMNPFLAYAA